MADETNTADADAAFDPDANEAPPPPDVGPDVMGAVPLALASVPDENALALAQMPEMFRDMPLSIRMLMDPVAYERSKQVAKIMSQAVGFTPAHLLGKPSACFVIVQASIQWRMAPFMVARATYQTPGGQTGFYGTLVSAILEASGQLEGEIEYDYFGDWAGLDGMFRVATSKKGKEFVVPTWTLKTAKDLGCGLRLHYQLRDRKPSKPFEMRLAQMFPLNSTLWATDPATQMGYATVRRMATARLAGLMMGVDTFEIEYRRMVDITPSKEELAAQAEAEAASKGSKLDQFQAAHGGIKTTPPAKGKAEPAPAKTAPEKPAPEKPPEAAPAAETTKTAEAPPAAASTPEPKQEGQEPPKPTPPANDEPLQYRVKIPGSQDADIYDDPIEAKAALIAAAIANKKNTAWPMMAIRMNGPILLQFPGLEERLKFAHKNGRDMQ